MTSRSAVSGLAPGTGQQFPVLVTGEQYELTAGDYHAVVTGLGAGLRELSYAGQPVVYGYEPDELPPGAAGQLLAPWPNRVDHGRYEFEGAAYQLDLSEPKNGNAIHGLTRWAAWEPMHREPSRVLLRHLPHGYTGYPFSVQIDTEYELTAGEGLQVTVSATNRGSRAAPYGTGQHPYFTAGPAALDEWELELPAARWLPLDERGIPIRARPRTSSGTPVDFRDGHPIGGHRAGPRPDRAGPGRGRPGLGPRAFGRPPGEPVGGPGLRLAPGIHQRHPARRAAPPGRRHRAHDLSAERAGQRGRSDRAGPRGERRAQLGCGRYLGLRPRGEWRA